MDKQPNSRHCFVCGVDNPAGVQVAFYEHPGGPDGPPEVHARFTPHEHHQGYPDRLHGGVISAVLDEVIGRAINIARGGEETVWGVAVELSVRFRRPVPLEVELTARGRVHRPHRLFEGTGELYLPDGSVAASAEGRYLALPLEEIADADPEALGWRVYGD